MKNASLQAALIKPTLFAEKNFSLNRLRLLYFALSFAPMMNSTCLFTPRIKLIAYIDFFSVDSTKVLFRNVIFEFFVRKKNANK